MYLILIMAHFSQLLFIGFIIKIMASIRCKSFVQRDNLDLKNKYNKMGTHAVIETIKYWHNINSRNRKTFLTKQKVQNCNHKSTVMYSFVYIALGIH